MKLIEVPEHVSNVDLYMQEVIDMIEPDDFTVSELMNPVIERRTNHEAKVLHDH